MSERCVYTTSSGCVNATISLLFIKSIHMAVVSYPHCGCGEIRRVAGHDRAPPSQAGRGEGHSSWQGTAAWGMRCDKKCAPWWAQPKKSPARGGASNQLNPGGI